MPRTKQTKPRHITEESKANKDGKSEVTKSPSISSPCQSPECEKSNRDFSISESEDKDILFSHSPSFDDVTAKQNCSDESEGDQDVENVDVEDLTGKTSEKDFVCDNVSTGQTQAVQPQSTDLLRNNADNSEDSSPSTINKPLTMWSHENNEQKQDFNHEQQKINNHNPTKQSSENLKQFNDKKEPAVIPNTDDKISSLQTELDKAPKQPHSTGDTPHSFEDKSVSGYFNTIKSLLGSNATKFLDSNAGAWKEWLKPPNPLNQGPSNNSSLVNGYMKQILESWNSVMQDRSNGSSLFYPPFQYASGLSNNSASANDHSAKTDVYDPSGVKTENTSESASLRVSPENNQSKDFSSRLLKDTSSNGDVKKEQSHLMEHNPQFASTKSSGSRQDDEKHTVLKRNNTMSPASLSSSQQTSSLANSLSKSYDFYSVPTAASALPTQALGYDKHSQLMSNPFYSYSSWPASSWLGYQAPNLSAFSSQFPYQPFPATSLTSKELTKSLRKSSFRQEKSSVKDTVSSPSSVSTSLPSSNIDPQLEAQFKFRRKRSEPTSTFPKIPEQTSSLLEAYKQQYNLPYMPYSSHWLGSGLALNPAIPSPYANLSSKKDISKMFHPSDMMSFRGIGSSSAMSPSGESTSYTSTSPYTQDHPLSSSVGKMLGSRRSRTRRAAFDSVHAAIVREAKEQSKGVDPENMYIQCPICQKRIKRLYHFQRHMRIHTGEKSHQCPCCQYKSVRKDNLKSHMKTHEKQNLEGGKKSSKALHQTSQSSSVSSEKSHNSSSGSTSSSKSAEPLVSDDGVQNSCLNLTLQSTSHDLSSRDSSPSSSMSLPQLGEINNYQTTANYQPLVKYEASPKNTPASPQNYKNDVGLGLNDVKSNDESMEHRLKYVDFPGAVRTHSRPNSEPISDTESRSKKRDNASYSSQNLGSEGSSKRRKLSRESPASESDMPVNLTNINNNNDGSKRNIACDPVTPFSLPFFISQRFAKDLTAPKFDFAANLSNKSNHLALLNQATATEEIALNQTMQCRLESEKSSETVSATLAGPTELSKATMTTTARSAGALSFVTEKKCNQSEDNRMTTAASNLKAFHGSSPLFYPNCYSQAPSNQPSYLSLPPGINPLTIDAKLADSSLIQNHLSKKMYQERKNQLLKESLSKAKLKENHADHKTPKSKNLQDPAVPNKILQCRLCSFTSYSNIELQSHVTAKHKQNGFYKCEECTYLGKNLSKLVEHIRIHTGERPFKCDQCNYAAKRKDNLAQHKAVRHDKRKAKSGSHYPAIPDLKPESVLAAACGSHLLHNAKQMEQTALAAKAPLGLPDHGLSPRMSLYGGFACGKDQEMANNSSASGPLTPPLHSFASVHALPSSLFQYPYYRFPPAINSPELENDLSGAVSKPINNTGTYSLKVRSALIAP